MSKSTPATAASTTQSHPELPPPLERSGAQFLPQELPVVSTTGRSGHLVSHSRAPRRLWSERGDTLPHSSLASRPSGMAARPSARPSVLSSSSRGSRLGARPRSQGYNRAGQFSTSTGGSRHALASSSDDDDMDDSPMEPGEVLSDEEESSDDEFEVAIDPDCNCEPCRWNWAKSKEYEEASSSAPGP